MIPKELKDKIDFTSLELGEMVTDAFLWDEAIEAFANRTYNGAQIKAIMSAASPSLHDEIEEQGTDLNLSIPLAGALTDSARKTCLLIDGYLEQEMEDCIPEVLYNGKKCFEDIVFNFPLLLGDNIPPAIEIALESYQKKITELELLYNELNAALETPHTPDPKKLYYNGREHLQPLPADFATLTETPPEPEQNPEP